LSGDAQNHGDLYGQGQSGIVGMAVTPDGGGYYVVRNDGAVFLFGNAQNHGDLYGQGQSGIVGMAVTPDGGGYFLVRNDGAVFLFGNAPNFGDQYLKYFGGGTVGFAVNPNGSSYYLVYADGSVFTQRASGSGETASTVSDTSIDIGYHAKWNKLARTVTVVS